MRNRKDKPAAEADPAAEVTTDPESDTPEPVADLDPLQLVEQERDEWHEKFLRSAAELDNYRKRMRREVSQSRDQGVADLAGGLFDVIDNLERALAAVAEADKGHGLGQGVSMVLEQVKGVLDTFGVTVINAVGQPFDPHRHEAILEVEQPGATPGTVLEEARRGYVMGDRLLRASQVLVAKAAVVEPPLDTLPLDTLPLDTLPLDTLPRDTPGEDGPGDDRSEEP